MITINAVIRKFGLATRRGQARFRGQILKKGLQETIRHWHSTQLMQHFDKFETVSAKYPGAIAKRSATYLKRKRKKVHHIRINEYSGATKRSMRDNYALSGTSKGTRIRMKVPQIKSQSKKGKWSSRPIARLTMETTATNRRDEHLLSKFLENYLTHAANTQMVEQERVEIWGWGGGL